jgi:hypothetical protein
MAHHGLVERISTTVVALIGTREGATASLQAKPNVTFYQLDPSAQPIEQAAAAWDAARHTHTPYFVHEADPLAWVAAAWSARFEGSGEVGDLEVALAETLARWRAHKVELPDYYVISSPGQLPGTLRHWYLGVLAGARRSRVVVAGEGADLAALLATLPTGPWWPGLEQLLEGIENVVPEQAGLQLASC